MQMAWQLAQLPVLTAGCVWQALDDAHIDMLVVAAGIQEPDTLDDVTHDIIRRQMEVNALGPVFVVQALKQRLSPGAKVRFRPACLALHCGKLWCSGHITTHICAHSMRLHADGPVHAAGEWNTRNLCTSARAGGIDSQQNGLHRGRRFYRRRPGDHSNKSCPAFALLLHM